MRPWSSREPLHAQPECDCTPTSWTINWGDGTIETFAGNPASVTHTYNAAIPSIFTYNILASAVCGGTTYFQNDLVVASSCNDRVNWYAHDRARHRRSPSTGHRVGRTRIGLPGRP